MPQFPLYNWCSASFWGIVPSVQQPQNCHNDTTPRCTLQENALYINPVPFECLELRICFPHLRLIRASISIIFSLQKHSHSHSSIPTLSPSLSLSLQWREPVICRLFCTGIILSSLWIGGRFFPTISFTAPTILRLLRFCLCQISCIRSRRGRAHVLWSRGLPPCRWSTHRLRRRLLTLASRRKLRGWRGWGRPCLAAGCWRRSWGWSSRILG